MGNRSYRTHRLRFSLFEEEVMPWKECSVMDERLQFVARRQAGSRALQGARNFRQDRLQDFRSLSGMLRTGTDGQKPPSLSEVHQLPFQGTSPLPFAAMEIGLSSLTVTQSGINSRHGSSHRVLRRPTGHTIPCGMAEIVETFSVPAQFL